MTTFKYTFEPASKDPASGVPDLPLLPQEIENAGLMEVLQTPGVAMGTWSILGALLDPGNSEFVFKEPLGAAREVKVAVSGLFGRFVARAYAMKYLGYTHFSHIGSLPMSLAAPFNAVVDRVPGKKGDMPDWVAWSAANGLAIVEAKGSHDPAGPGQTLKRAFEQAQRASVRVNGRKARLKQFAIATRWGFASGPFSDPMLAVKDPEELGENVSRHEYDAAALGVVRRHIAGLLKPLGHAELAAALVDLTNTPDDGSRTIERAIAALEQTAQRRVTGTGVAVEVPLVGGIVVKGGPLGREVPADRIRQDQLVELDLRPTFIGVEYDAIRAAIVGDLPKIKVFAETADSAGLDPNAPHRDRSATWVVRIEADGNRVE